MPLVAFLATAMYAVVNAFGAWLVSRRKPWVARLFMLSAVILVVSAAAFVSSIIEQGFDPKGMDEVRQKFKKEGLESYDVLSPALMDLIATYTAQKSGKLSSKL